MLDEIVSASDARLNAKGVACEASISSDFEPVGDSFMFQQALFNLMDNALDFVECNGLILWQYSQSGEQVALSIFNAGPPIPDYAMPRLTERFYSLARQNGVKSTGLGLNFVEQVVKLHKGSLLIENVEQGVKVTLSFPSP